MAQSHIQPESDETKRLPLMAVRGARIRKHGLRTYNAQTLRLDLMFDLGGERDTAKESCRDPKWIAAALGMLRAIEGSTRVAATSHRCLYVMEAEGSGFCKVGVSVDPVDRAVSIQTACPHPIRLHACVFSPTLQVGILEQATLRRASRMGVSAQGEWIKATADEAMALVLDVAWRECIPVCDAETWFLNLRGSTLSQARRMGWRLKKSS